MDKTQSIRQASQAALNQIVKNTAPEGIRQVANILTEILADSKGWRTKVGVLKCFEALVKPGSEEWVADILGQVIPSVEGAMHDTKSEVCQLFIPCYQRESVDEHH